MDHLEATDFYAVGGTFKGQYVKELVAVVRARNYEKLQLESRVIEGERHAGNKPEAFNRGLRFVFQK